MLVYGLKAKSDICQELTTRNKEFK